MPTIITHAITAIPTSLGFKNNINSKRIIFLSILFSMLPDFDGIGFAYGVKYDSLLGHRGLSHSLFFISICAIIFAFLTLPNIMIKSKQFLFLFINFLSIGSLHILLDAMTNGGLGVALFSPFNMQRFFMPWTPIQVSAISPQYFFQLDGLTVIKIELLYLIAPSIFISIFIIFIKKRLFKK